MTDSILSYKDPKVTLLNKPDILEGFQLWLKSREAIIEYDGDDIIVGGQRDDLDAYTSKILKMNLQYNNFPFFIFEIQGSLLSRDVFFNCTEISQWATSTRFFHSLSNEINYDAFSISSEYKGKSEDQMLTFLKLMKSESNPDKARLEMPYSLSTRYWIGLNLKTLVSFLGLLKIKLPFFYETYGKLILDQVPEVEELIPNFVDDIYWKYFNPDNSPKDSKSIVNDYIHLHTNMGMILYSQFLRQSSATTSGLYSYLSDDSEKIPVGKTRIPIYHTSHLKRFMRTVSNRTCAFSMSDDKSENSWYHILEPYLKDMDLEEFKSILPCKYDKNQLKFCKFREDIKFRNNKFEKNLPCPMLACNVGIAEERYKNSDTSLNKLYLELTKTLEPSEVTLEFNERTV